MIGSRLRARREALGLNQREVAEMIDVSLHDAIEHEAGRLRVSARHLMAYMRVLQTTPEAIYRTDDLTEREATILPFAAE